MDGLTMWCYFCCNTGITDLSDICRKFYGHFNSILSYLVNAQMKWLLYIWQKLTVYLLSRMDVKSGHWLITVCTPSALHGNNCFRLIF